MALRAPEVLDRFDVTRSVDLNGLIVDVRNADEAVFSIVSTCDWWRRTPKHRIGQRSPSPRSFGHAYRLLSPPIEFASELADAGSESRSTRNTLGCRWLPFGGWFSLAPREPDLVHGYLGLSNSLAGPLVTCPPRQSFSARASGISIHPATTG